VRNPKVVAELKSVLKHWLDLGVDGFRMDAVAHLFEDKDLSNDNIDQPPRKAYGDYSHDNTYNLQPEVIDLLKEFRYAIYKFIVIRWKLKFLNG